MRVALTPARLGRAAVLAVALAAPLAAVPVGPAQAGPSGPSVPSVPGRLMSYVVNTGATPARVQQAERAVRAAGGTVVQSWPQIGVVVAHARARDFRARVLASRSAGVASVGATRTTAVVAPPDAPPFQGFPTLGLPREGRAYDVAAIGTDRAHALPGGRGSRDVLVAVLDSGVDAQHPDLRGAFDAGASVGCQHAGRPDTRPSAWRPTTSDHGTHVAGTVAAADDGKGVVGVAPGVRISSVKVVDDAGLIYPEYAVCGMVWAAEHGADITNNSYYIDPWTFWCGSDPQQAAVKQAVSRAFAYATRRGVLSVAAAGNAGTDLATTTLDESSPDDSAPVRRRLDASCTTLPAELPGVVTVSATDRTGALAGFSNRGLGVIDVAAPGDEIWSTTPSGTYGVKSGTSMASPHVAGVAALLKSTRPAATPARLLDLLRAQARDTPCPGRPCTGPASDNSFFGEGTVDAYAAVSGR